MSELVTAQTVAWMAVDGRLEPVWVRGADGGARIDITDLSGTEQKVARARLFWLGASVLPSAERLSDYLERVRNLAASADLDAAWTAVADATVDTVATAAAALPGCDAAPALQVDALVLAVFEDPLLYRIRQHTMTRRTAEEVSQLVAKRTAAEAKQRQETGCIEAIKARLAGETPTDEQHAALAVSLPELRGLACAQGDAKGFAEGKRILRALERPLTGAFQLLVDIGEFSRDENLSLWRSGLPQGFSAEVLAAAADATPSFGRIGEDLRGALTVAIDDPSTTEVDDAFALVGERLHVLIADAAAWVPRGGVVDDAARARGSTLYLPTGNFPMLPRSIGEVAASLRAGEERTALDFSFELDATGRPIGFDIRRVTCQVDHQLSYEQADALLSGEADDADPKLRELLQRAASFMDRHRNARRELGALFFQRNEVYLAVDADGDIRIKRGDPYNPGRQLVSELMIAACSGAAQFCVEQEIPCIFRTQATPDGVLAAHGNVTDQAAQHAILKRLKPSVLTTKVSGHFTLGVAAYTQLTSPLRRYTDLLMHQQLSRWLASRQPAYSLGQLRGAFEPIERSTTAIRRVENESKRFWAIRYLERHFDLKLEGQIVRELGRRWLVELDLLGMTVPIKLKGPTAIGDRLVLEVEAADARADRLVLRRVADGSHGDAGR